MLHCLVITVKKKTTKKRENDIEDMDMDVDGYQVSIMITFGF